MSDADIRSPNLAHLRSSDGQLAPWAELASLPDAPARCARSPRVVGVLEVVKLVHHDAGAAHVVERPAIAEAAIEDAGDVFGVAGQVRGDGCAREGE